MARSRRRLGYALAFATATLVAADLGLAKHFRLGALEVPGHALRCAATPILAWWHADDLTSAAAMQARAWVGAQPSEPVERVRSARASAVFSLEAYDGGPLPKGPVDFVFERSDADFLVRLRERLDLEQLVAGATDDFEAMLRVGAWVAALWDHGTSAIPGGSKEFDPLAAIDLGAQGAKFWCEISARTMVHAATALGWCARTATGSLDGYTWLHTVAELWSDRFDKWFVLDTAFGIYYEAEGLPLSAFDLCHDGERHERDGALQKRRFAPRKPSLPDSYLRDFYAYVHIDLRNDWFTRRLPPGSPAGGERATWWTARESIGPLLSAKIRVDDRARFDWPINRVDIAVASCEAVGEEPRVELLLRSYSPHFAGFEWRLDEAPWTACTSGSVAFACSRGSHQVSARVRLPNGFVGRTSHVRFRLQDGSPAAHRSEVGAR